MLPQWWLAGVRFNCTMYIVESRHRRRRLTLSLSLYIDASFSIPRVHTHTLESFANRVWSYITHMHSPVPTINDLQVNNFAH